MKIGILTLVPYDNYGGILQAYALQTILERKGHEVYVFNTKLYNYKPLKRKIIDISRWAIKKMLRIPGTPCIMPYSYQVERVADIKPFIQEHINLTRTFSSKEDLYRYQEEKGYDAFVVGSDQTWRPMLSPDLYHMFLDFLPADSLKKRISYAASFGVDELTFTSKQMEVCVPLLKRFDNVSVREVSGVDICKKYFGVDAVHVLDPTMLLDKNDYLKLIENYKPINQNVELMQYVFFFNDEKRKIIKKISEICNENPVNLMTGRFLHEVYEKEHLKETVFYPVEEWIYAYSKSSFVITDSFHGTVFCIIFNIPFIVVSPVAVTRFKSLLSIYNLEDRLVCKASDITGELINSSIDWNFVNNKREELKQKSLLFLYNSLE